MPVLSGFGHDPDEYVATAIEHAVAGTETSVSRQGGWLVGTEDWADEHGHWLRVRVEIDARPGLEVHYSRVLLPAAGPDKSPETEAAIYSSGFEERLHLRAPTMEPVDGIIAL